MRSSCLSAVLAAFLSFVSTGALAQSMDLDVFGLHPGPAGDEVVSSGRNLDGGGWRVSVLANYQHQAARLAGAGSPVDHRLLGHLTLAYGITDWLQIHGQLPVVLMQLGPAGPDGFGLATASVGARASLLRQDAGGFADLSAAVTLGLPFGSIGALGRNDGVAVLPELSIGRELVGLRLGASLGAYLRPSSSVAPATPGFPSQSDLRLGASVTTTNTEGPRGELAARLALGLEKPAIGGEVLAGVRAPLWEGGEGFVLAGPGFGPLMGTPAFRILMGITFGSPDRPSDPDGDGITGAADQCPQEPEDFDGFEDEDGCPDPDNDGDGVPDAEDACPTVAADTNDGCPVPDRDGDGVPDAEDVCPDEAGPAEKKGCAFLDEDGDGVEDTHDRCPGETGLPELAGCPARDDDGDGVPNHRDNCPQMAGPADNQGCPAEEKQQVVMAGTELKILDRVYFGTGNARIQRRSHALLRQVASVLKNQPGIKVVAIDGHSDSTGSAETNRRLSQLRAEAVLNFLVEEGVSEDRLTARGFGPDQPAESNDTPEGREANRRVEFQILEQDLVQRPVEGETDATVDEGAADEAAEDASAAPGTGG